jgi:hypothetical protein
MKNLLRLFGPLLLLSIVLMTSCKPDNTHNITVTYEVVHGDNGNTSLKANIQNSSSIAMTNIKIDFTTTPEHKVIQYNYPDIICEGQSVDVEIPADFEFDTVDSYKVNSCEETVCP